MTSERPICDDCGKTLYGDASDWRDDSGSPFCYPNMADGKTHRPVLIG